MQAIEYSVPNKKIKKGKIYGTYKKCYMEIREKIQEIRTIVL